MEFSDTTNKDGIIQQLEHKTNLGDTGISGNSTLLKQFTASINNAYSRVASLIIQADERMRWDDPNHGDAPTKPFTLVSGQKNYSIFEAAPTALVDWLEVDRVDILDANGDGIHLTRKDEGEIDEAVSEFESVAGTPKTFRIRGSEIFLDPAPNYASASGGTIYFNRAPSYYASDATTKRPGFSTLFHELLVLWPLYWWALTKDQTYAVGVRNEIIIMEDALEKFYSRRDKTSPPRMSTRRQNNK